MRNLRTAKSEIHLQGFGRCRSCRHKRAQANRWSNWAATLHARHTRIGHRQRALALVLTRNQAVNLHRVDHRHYRSLQVLLRLSIGPFLRFLPGLRMPTMQFSPKGFAPLDVIASGRSRSDPRQWSMEENISPRGGASFKPAGNKPQEMTVLLPITRIADRLFEAIERQFSTRFDVQSVAQSVQLVNRVINERKRFEEQTRRTVVTRNLREYQKSEMVSRERIAGESDHTALSVSNEVSRMPGRWPFDVEQLTDQVVRTIDSRIVAHRERMGNVF